METLLYQLESRALIAGIEIEDCHALATSHEKIASRLAMGRGAEIDDMDKWHKNYCKIISNEGLTQFVADAVAAQERKIKIQKMIEDSRQELI